jgi:hypothetical protein
MNSRDIAHLRLANQRIAGSSFGRPEELVKWMGCVQAQDYGMAKWAVGCRLKEGNEAGIEDAFKKGMILRTHVLRPTWHFVCPEDIGWMLKISAPKIRAMMKRQLHQLGIDHVTLEKSKRILTKVLGLHRRMTRQELTKSFLKEKIATGDSRVGHLLLDAELDALICSAGRTGKQFAYGLFEERVPKSRVMHKEAAFAELARRYFLSRGPATVQDFAWWSGLTLTNARDGLDEQFAAACSGGLKPVVIHNGKVAGVWRRAENKDRVVVKATYFASPAPVRAYAVAVKKYAAFFGKTATAGK